MQTAYIQQKIWQVTKDELFETVYVFIYVFVDPRYCVVSYVVYILRVFVLFTFVYEIYVF